jgi:glyoxylase-like metal-dependent hydrolase (beta-lactamase superfamily II)
MMIRPLLLPFLGILLLSNAKHDAVPASLEIRQLKGDFYIYTTYNYYKGMRIPANGMYVVTSRGVLVIDSPWDTTQFQPLLDSIEDRHNKKAVLCLATHFHEDRTAGLEYFRSKGISTYTTMLTDEWSAKKGMKRAEHLLAGDTLFNLGDHSFQVIYPGPGHAPDNIVIWFEKEKVLYGGCLVKSTADKDLGNLGDADTAAYEATIEKVMKKCRNPAYVVPGHNSWNSVESLEHTLRMAKKLKAAAGKRDFP